MTPGVPGTTGDAASEAILARTLLLKAVWVLAFAGTTGGKHVLKSSRVESKIEPADAPRIERTVAAREREPMGIAASIERREAEQPSATDAVERVIDAGQRVVTE